jgi:hypothetical protein
MKKIYRIEILKSVDGWFYEIYLNGNRAGKDIRKKIIEILGDDIETVIGKLHEPGSSEHIHPRFVRNWNDDDVLDEGVMIID